ncbi:uncharacterized protein HKW66_Vig0149960 [Vigna angularis]|uniref:Uncharacterized protein n=1 Tax=Phaseolus angularis TaxID=3914 RepID=A0A8T0JX99_PHAAN|nr:uncharacterized protein HKW66_Vig0149960 [Vigna angularis]
MLKVSSLYKTLYITKMESKCLHIKLDYGRKRLLEKEKEATSKAQQSLTTSNVIASSEHFAPFVQMILASKGGVSTKCPRPAASKQKKAKKLKKPSSTMERPEEKSNSDN